jgi:hypothetical protein
MKRDFTLLKRIRNTLIILILGIFMMGGSCYEINCIDQPTEVQVTDFFDTKIVIVPKDDMLNNRGWGEDLTANGIIGILLPDGWKVKDSIEYSEMENCPECFLIFCSEVVSFLNNYKDITVPAGYHWWGAISNYKLDGETFSGVSVNITIRTGKKDGNYNLQYVFGDTSPWNGADPYSIVTKSEFNPTISLTSHSSTSWKNEDWEVYPNPSKGQIYIRQGNISEEVLMKVYDLNGKIHKSDVLRENLNYVDLSSLSMGVYIVSLENQGEVKTKQLIIQ